MTAGNRVAWREGQFLRPQHFQQADRSADFRLHARAEMTRPYPWGISELVIDEQLAAIGKFAISRAVGVLPDGTAFSIPAEQPPPPPLDLPPDTRDTTIYLTLAPSQLGSQEFAEVESVKPETRFGVSEQVIVDCFSTEREREPIEIARPNLAFGVTRDQTYGRVLCGLAQVREMKGKSIQFDDRYIPPCQDIAASVPLRHGLADILGRCDQRSIELAREAAETIDGGVGTFASFLLLQALNRWIPVLRHLESLPTVHPERLFEQFSSIAGEIATLVRPDRRAPLLEPYHHEKLRDCFAPLIDQLQTMLAAVFDRTAIQLPLKQINVDSWVSPIVDRSLYAHAYFYLAVRAAASTDEIRRSFAQMAKVGSVERMQQIVNAALPGVPLRHATTPPPQIRVIPGYVYFELDRGAQDWADFSKATGLGLHVAGEWPELKLELWCVKGTGR